VSMGADAMGCGETAADAGANAITEIWIVLAAVCDQEAPKRIGLRPRLGIIPIALGLIGGNCARPGEGVRWITCKDRSTSKSWPGWLRDLQGGTPRNW
jgi:hypothetical protein